jgi:hypothetical protein
MFALSSSEFCFACPRACSTEEHRPRKHSWRDLLLPGIDCLSMNFVVRHRGANCQAHAKPCPFPSAEASAQEEGRRRRGRNLKKLALRADSGSAHAFRRHQRLRELPPTSAREPARRQRGGRLHGLRWEFCCGSVVRHEDRRTRLSAYCEEGRRTGTIVFAQAKIKRCSRYEQRVSPPILS